MINELTLKRDALLKNIDKNKIARDIKGILPSVEVMFIYFGGSVAYNSFVGDKSDFDLVVFVDGFHKVFQTSYNNMDLFIYPKNAITERYNKDNDYPFYKQCFLDDVLSLPATLVYLNPNYEKEYNEFKNKDFNGVLHGFLDNFYNYHMFCFIGLTEMAKKFYHVIRMKGQIENYKKTGKFTLDIAPEYYKEMMDLKLHYDDKNRKDEFLKKIEEYLKDIYEFKEVLTYG